MKRTGLIIAVVGALAACGDASEIRHDGTMNPVPTQVRGSITGRVLDPAGQPVEGAQVLYSTAKGVRSHAVRDDGYFLVEGVPAGGYLPVRIEAEGYTFARLRPYLSADAGDYPQEGTSRDLGDILLFPRSDELETRVLLSPGAEKIEVEGATCSFGPTFLREQSGNDPNRYGSFESEAESSEGLIRCLDLPALDLLAKVDGWVEITVPPQDLDGDGYADFEGGRFVWGALELLTEGPSPIELHPRSETLEIVRSNVPFLLGMELLPALPADADVEIDFSHPVEVLFHELRTFPTDEEIEHTVEVDGNRVTLKGAAPWVKGGGYGAFLLVSPVGSPRIVKEISAQFIIESSGAIEVSATFADLDEDGVAAANEPIALEFSEYFLLEGTNFEVQFNHDLDESGEIGDGPYELGSGTAVPGAFDAFAIVHATTLRVPFELPEGVEIVLLFEGQGHQDVNGNLIGDLVATLASEE